MAEDKQPLQAIFTLPRHYLQHDHVRSRHLIYCMCCCIRRLQPPHVATEFSCLRHLQVRRVGVALAHGDAASDWNGHLLTELAVALAAQGELAHGFTCQTLY